MIKMKILLMFMCLSLSSTIIADQNSGESDPGFLTSRPPNAPILNIPENKAINLADTVTMIWYSQIHSSSYRLQVSKFNDMSILLINQTDIEDTLYSTSMLENNTDYYWRVCGTNIAGEGNFSTKRQFTTASISSTDSEKQLMPKEYALLPAYPNPFNPSTMITYHLPEVAQISITILNNMGQTVRELITTTMKAGEHKVEWDGCNLHGVPVTSGLYICHFKCSKHVFTQKILLMR